MDGATALLARLRTKLQADERTLFDQTAKGLKRKEYWKIVGRIAQVRKDLDELNELIKAHNGGEDESTGDD